MNRSLKILFGSLIGAIALASVAFYWLFSTEGGLHWAIEKLGPQITVSSSHGTLTDVSFTNLDISLEATRIVVTAGKIDWSVIGLLNKEIGIHSIELVGVNIVTQPRPQNQQTNTGDINLPFSLIVEQAEINNISLRLNDSPPVALDVVQFDGSLRENILDLEQLHIRQSDNSANLNGQIDLSTSAMGLINIEHSSTWNYKNQTLDSFGSISGTWSSIDLTLEGTAPIGFKLNGHVDDVLSDSINWGSSLAIADLDSSMLAEQAISIGKVELESTGHFSPALGLESLIIELEGLVLGSHEEFPNWQLQTSLQIKDQNLSIESLNLKSLTAGQPAELQVSGTLKTPSFIGTPKIALDNSVVDLFGTWGSLTWPLRSESPSFISNGQFAITGPLNNIHLIAASNGETDEHDVTANIDLQLESTELIVNSFELAAADSSLRLYGNINERYQLSWEADSENIGSIFTDMSGQIAASGSVSGQRENPKVSFSAQSSGLSIGDFSIGTTEVTAVASPLNQSEDLTVSIAAKNLELDQQLVAESFNLEVDGSTQDHTITINSQLAKGSIAEIQASGQWLENQWNAVASNASIDNPTYGAWILDRDLLISVSSFGASASNSCLSNKSQSICAGLNYSKDALSLHGNFSGISLDNLSPLLEFYSLKAVGLVNGEFTYSKGSDDLTAIADATIAIQNSQITWLSTRADEQANETLYFESLKLALKQDSQFYADAELRISDDDLISGQVNIDSPINSENFQSAELVGSGVVSIKNLSVFPIAMLNGMGLSGTLNSDLSVEGTFNAPELYASAALQNASIELPDLGLLLEDIDLNLAANGETTLQMLGSLNSGSGRLNLSGSIELADFTNPYGDFSFKGENIQLVNTHELKAVGEVDISTKIDRDRLDISGLISMTQARLNFVLPESLIQASDDVLLEGETVQASRLERNLDISVDFGDDTQIEAQGFQSRLTGRIRIFQEPKGIMRGQGQLVLSDGFYQGYGQNLEIDDGHLVFTGGSIDEPDLDIQAQETIGDTVAGIHITGKASAPEVALYSTPSMNDEDILSMLMFRKPVSELSSQDGITLLSVASSLQGNGTNKITQLTDKVQQIFGLSSLELNLTGTEPSVYLGKQLSSRLNVGYGYTLLDAVQSLIIEYKVNQVWSIKANAGVTSGADLHYRIER